MRAWALLACVLHALLGAFTGDEDEVARKSEVKAAFPKVKLSALLPSKVAMHQTDGVTTNATVVRHKSMPHGNLACQPG